MKRAVVSAIATLVLISGIVGMAPAGLGLESPVGTASAAPPGFVNVPGENVGKSSQTVSRGDPPTSDLPASARGPPSDVLDKIPDHALERVIASKHPSSTSVKFAETGDGRLAMVVTDDKYSDGRRIGVPEDAVESAIGYKPDIATFVSENGDEWRDEVSYSDGYAIIQFEHFSTNTVTFGGNVTISATPAADGFQSTYDIGDLDAVSGPYTVDITGATQYQTDSETFGNAANGDSLSVSVGGTSDPLGPSGTADPEVTFTGVDQPTPQTKMATGVDLDAGSTTIVSSVGGNDAATGPASGSPQISLTADRFLHDISKDGSPTSNVPARITRVECQISSSSTDDRYWNISIDGNTVCEGQSGSGTSTDRNYVTVTNTSIDYTTGGSVTYSLYKSPTDAVSIEYIKVYSALPNGVTISHGADSTSAGSFTDGQTKTYSFGLSPGESVTLSGNGADMNYTLDYTEHLKTEDPAIDVDGGGADASHTGLLNAGQSATYDIAQLSTSTSSVSLSTAGGSTTDVNITYREQTETIDPAVEVNGNYLNHTGTLADGTTNSFSTNTSWVRQGTNRVNVTVGDGTLTADAPTPSVDLTYQHGAESDQTTTYTSEIFQSRWETSYTYQSDRSDADLTVPVESEVVAIRGDVEKKVNSGSWSTVSTSNWDLGNNLVVQLGSVTAADNVSVRFDTSKVDVNNGTITVTRGTSEDNALDSDITLDSWASDSYIQAGGTTIGQRAMKVTSSSHTRDPYLVFSGTDQELHLPNAGDGDTITAEESGLSVSPVFGDVRVEIEEDTTEPKFVVKEGPDGPEDDIKYTFEDASAGTDYILWSVTSKVVRDSGTASSPLTLEDDDSEETLQFQEDTATSSSGGGGGGGGGVAPAPSSGGSVAADAGATIDAVLSNIPILGGVALVIGAVALFARRRFGTDPDVASRVGRSRGVVGSITGILTGILVAFSALVFRAAAAGRAALGRRSVQLGLGALGVVFLFAADIIVFTSEERTIILVVGVLLGVFLGLNRLDRFTWPLYSVIAATVIIFGLNAMGTDILGQFIDSPVFPLFGAGALYLAWKAFQTWREGRSTEVVLNVDDSQ